MRRIWKIAQVMLCVLLLGVATVIGYVFATAASPPEGAEQVIADTVASQLPELIRGEAGYASSNGLSIWFESLKPRQPARGTILLIIGISNDAFGWPRSLIDALLAEGYQVIRFDNRGTGLSDWDTSATGSQAYSLLDMAADGVAVLDALGIERAHLVGASMGGMIAQELAAAFPDRTASLTAIMSSGHIEDPALPGMSRRTTKALVKTKIRYGFLGGEANLVRLHLANRMILMGRAEYELDVREVAESVLYNLRKRRGYNVRATIDHQTAVRLSGSRYAALADLRVPALIIHGRDDPLVPIAHGVRLVEAIPGARGVWLDNMGHDIPEHLAGTLAREMARHFERSKPGAALSGLAPGALGDER
jgi:pimeloyl-ACP methyl ester carboxylesterase